MGFRKLVRRLSKHTRFGIPRDAYIVTPFVYPDEPFKWSAETSATAAGHIAQTPFEAPQDDMSLPEKPTPQRPGISGVCARAGADLQVTGTSSDSTAAERNDLCGDLLELDRSVKDPKPAEQHRRSDAELALSGSAASAFVDTTYDHPFATNAEYRDNGANTNAVVAADALNVYEHVSEESVERHSAEGVAGGVGIPTAKPELSGFAPSAAGRQTRRSYRVNYYRSNFAPPGSFYTYGGSLSRSATLSSVPSANDPSQSTPVRRGSSPGPRPALYAGPASIGSPTEADVVVHENMRRFLQHANLFWAAEAQRAIANAGALAYGGGLVNGTGGDSHRPQQPGSSLPAAAVTTRDGLIGPGNAYDAPATSNALGLFQLYTQDDLANVAPAAASSDAHVPSPASNLPPFTTVPLQTQSTVHYHDQINHYDAHPGDPYFTCTQSQLYYYYDPASHRPSAGTDGAHSPDGTQRETTASPDLLTQQADPGLSTSNTTTPGWPGPITPSGINVAEDGRRQSYGFLDLTHLGPSERRQGSHAESHSTPSVSPQYHDLQGEDGSYYDDQSFEYDAAQSGSRFANVYEATNGTLRSERKCPDRPLPPPIPENHFPSYRAVKDAQGPPPSRADLKKLTKHPLPHGPIPYHFVLPTHGYPRFCKGNENGQNSWHFCLPWLLDSETRLGRTGRLGDQRRFRGCLYCGEFIPEDWKGNESGSEITADTASISSSELSWGDAGDRRLKSCNPKRR